MAAAPTVSVTLSANFTLVANTRARVLTLPPLQPSDFVDEVVVYYSSDVQANMATAVALGAAGAIVVDPPADTDAAFDAIPDACFNANLPLEPKLVDGAGTSGLWYGQFRLPVSRVLSHHKRRMVFDLLCAKAGGGSLHVKIFRQPAAPR